MIQDSHPASRVVYEVDGNDTLCAVNPAWSELPIRCVSHVANRSPPSASLQTGD